jgi:hypothetical protein
MTTKPKSQKYFIKGLQIFLIIFRYGSSNFLLNFITKKKKKGGAMDNVHHLHSSLVIHITFLGSLK